MANGTSGHESEFINVEDLKAALQKFKTDKVDVKVDKVTGKGLSTNDYTTDEKNKLAGIAAGAEVNVQSDWNASSGDAFIKNKPTIPTVNDGTLTIKLNGTSKGTFTANQSGPSTIELTDTTYSNKSATSGGTDVSLVTTGEKYTWNSKTSNTGTVTSVAVKMNGATKGTVTTSGTINLGTVLTSHQDISGKQDKLTFTKVSGKSYYKLNI